MTTTTRLIILYPSYFFPCILHFIYKNIQRCIASAVTTTIERSYGRICRIMKRLMYTCITRRKRKDTLALNEYLIRQQNNELVLSFFYLGCFFFFFPFFFFFLVPLLLLIILFLFVSFYFVIISLLRMYIFYCHY